MTQELRTVLCDDSAIMLARVQSPSGAEITCRARMVHGGRTTQLWDAEVADGTGRTLALFRCTQMVLYPRTGVAA